MRAALCIRADARTNPGGDWVQLEKTAAALERQGVTCDIHVGGVPGKADVVHAFNLTRLSNTLQVADWARTQGVPLLISPIWHSLDDMSRFYGALFHVPVAFPIAPYLAVKELVYERKRWTPYVLRALTRWRANVRATVAQAAMILPNSPEELATLQRDTGAQSANSLVVPNAVDLGLCMNDTVPRTRTIVCSGRIEPRKNTLEVVRAFLRSASLSDWRLLLLGQASERHPEYVAQVMRHVDEQRVVWFDHVPFEQAQRIYAGSQVLILASHFETTGLVGLEGLYQGCQVIMTRRCYTEYYYADRVLYCDPYDSTDIQQTMEIAATRRVPRPDEAYFQHFSWENVGRLTRRAYDMVMQP